MTLYFVSLFKRVDYFILVKHEHSLSISIVTRAYNSSELNLLVDKLSMNDETKIEIIAVCKNVDKKYSGVNIIQENSNRTEAKITGIKNANYDRILLIDSDQFPEVGLLSELESIKDDMVIVPERSSNKNLVGTLMDDLRDRDIAWAKKISPIPTIPVIPRVYKKDILREITDNLPKQTFEIQSHEDSILYFHVYKKTKNITFSQNHIYNVDPSFSVLLKKAYTYGKYYKEARKVTNSDEITHLIKSLNASALNLKERGIGIGIYLQLIRAIAYAMGELFG